MLELNPELQALLIGFITLLVTEGLKSLGSLIGFDLSGAAAALTAGVVAVLLSLVNGLFGLIPPAYFEIAQVVMTLLVAILGSFGAHRQLTRFGARG